MCRWQLITWRIATVDLPDCKLEITGLLLLPCRFPCSAIFALPVDMPFRAKNHCGPDCRKGAVSTPEGVDPGPEKLLGFALPVGKRTSLVCARGDKYSASGGFGSNPGPKIETWATLVMYLGFRYKIMPIPTLRITHSSASTALRLPSTGCAVRLPLQHPFSVRSDRRSAAALEAHSLRSRIP